MSDQLRRLLAAWARLLASWALPCVIATAAPLTFELRQDGWEGGGRVTASFSGEDVNGDGFLNLANGEISAYQVEFSGNSIIAFFSHDLADLLFFNYELGSPGFPPSFPLFSDNGSFFYDADDRIIGGSGFTAPFIITSEPAVVIPEPSTWMLLGLGLAGAAALRTRRFA